MSSRLLAITAVALAALTGVSTAQAAQRYVAVNAGGTCAQNDPCSLTAGINSAASNDEVIIAPGSYTASAALTNNLSGVNVHGQAGSPRPVIASSFPTALSLNGIGARVSDLEIDHTGPNTALALFAFNSKLDRVRIRSTGSIACDVGPSVIARDAVCSSSKDGATALRVSFNGSTGSSKLRNITAIATGASSTGMQFGAGMNTTNTVDLLDVIASGAGTDIAGNATAANASLTVSASYSNFDTANAAGAGASIPAAGSGTNQIAAPIFADTTFFHEDPSSPTVDAGAVDADTSTVDLDGDARPQGAAADIGADELPFVAPPPTPPDPPPPGDTTPPQTMIAKGPKPKSKSKMATFVFNSNEAGSTFTCSVDKKPAAPCTSPLKLKHLKKGRHSLTVAATDAAGNTDPTAAPYGWKVKKRKKRR